VTLWEAQRVVRALGHSSECCTYGWRRFIRALCYFPCSWLCGLECERFRAYQDGKKA
jgi:hypothetical protein